MPPLPPGVAALPPASPGAAERLVVREQTVAYVRHRRRDGNIDRAALRLAAAAAVGTRPARDAVGATGLVAGEGAVGDGQGAVGADRAPLAAADRAARRAFGQVAREGAVTNGGGAVRVDRASLRRAVPRGETLGGIAEGQGAESFIPDER